MIIGVFGVIALNLIDSYFVGKMGALELAALGFTLPVVMILGAIGMGLGVGASAVISRAIGEGDTPKVRRLTTDSLVLATLFSLVFVVSGVWSMDPIFRALGASEEVLPLIKEYMYPWYIGVPFVMVPFVGNNAIRANGDTLTPSVIMVIMVVVNAVLDPIMIFGWGPIPAMGIEGAAVATVIARAGSFLLSLYILYFRDGLMTLQLPGLAEMLTSWKGILFIGLPAAATNLVVPLNTALITNLVAGYGEPAVAALGVASRIDVLAITVVIALSIVIGPFVGQNLGAGKIDRLKKGIRNSTLFSVYWGLGMLVLLWSTRSWIAPLFSESPEVIDVIILYLAITPLSYAMRGVYALGNVILNVMNKPLHASAITLIMMFGVYLPVAYLGSYWFGLPGVFGSIVVAYTLGGAASYLLVVRNLRKEMQEVVNSEPVVEQAALVK
jgi:putative MATE family efflux protein